MKKFLSIRRTFRLTPDEDTAVAKEAALCGYQLSSYIRVRVLDRLTGVRLARVLTIDLPLLSTALCQVGDLKRAVEDALQQVHDVKEGLTKNASDLFGLDGCVNELRRASREASAVFDKINDALLERLLTPDQLTVGRSRSRDEELGISARGE